LTEVRSKRAGTVWILTHSRTGDRQQMEHLVSLLGWPGVTKKLAFHPPNLPVLANLLLDHAHSDRLEPPWPDVVLCAEARPSVVARAIKRSARGKVKLVCLGRPAGSPDGFDLVVTTAQYRLPKQPNVMEIALPLVADPAPAVRAAVADDIAGTPLVHPITAVLVGGTSLPEALDEKSAGALAHALLDQVRKVGGTLLVTTSPRTGAAAARALAERIPPPHIVWEWRADAAASNPYRRFLALADRIIVTSDSVSMLADALVTKKTVSVYRLPRKWRLRDRLSDWLIDRTWARPHCPFWLTPAKWLFDQGLIEARADRTFLIDRLVAEERLAWFGEAAIEPKPHRDGEDIEAVVARIAALMPAD
jgi:uncharacterized protein